MSKKSAVKSRAGRRPAAGVARECVVRFRALEDEMRAYALTAFAVNVQTVSEWIRATLSNAVMATGTIEAKRLLQGK